MSTRATSTHAKGIQLARWVCWALFVVLVALLLLAFVTNDARPCAVCGETLGLSPSYEEPEFSDAYHTIHDKIRRCDYCGRILSDYTSAGPGVWKLDGRHMCPTCHSDAVVDWDDARRIAERVKRRMASWGLAFKANTVPVALVDEVTLRRLFATHGAVDGTIEGLTQHHQNARGEDTQILVLSGLPRPRCEWVLAHELMHAWLFQRHAPEHRPRLAEGAGELAAYRLLRERPTVAGRRLIAAALESRDPVYGEGLRLAAAYEKAHGFAAFVRLLAARRDYPATNARAR